MDELFYCTEQILKILKRIFLMQCFLYFLEGLNGCNIGQKDFHQRILNIMRKGTVKNFSLHFESSEEILSEVNIKPL